ncbi:hypothetical protein ACINK0_11385 [Deinococcus sp. VB343]|uniref:hypothetical protein n=1 Tax=Deinococcus sp. VB343 TaxID=3385567 RepID=UPI0039C8E6DB
MKALTTLLLLSLTLTPYQAVQFRSERVDVVEREIRGGNYRIFTTFLTVHQIGGKPVPIAEFWRRARTGKVIQAKVTRRAGLLWAARINLKE